MLLWCACSPGGRCAGKRVGTGRAGGANHGGWVARNHGWAHCPAASCRPWPARGRAAVIPSTARLGLIADRDTQSATLLETLLPLALSRLAEQYIDGEFVFTTTGEAAPGGGWTLRPAGRSVRYAAIVALGLLRVGEPEQRTVLAGQTAADLVGQLTKRLDEVSSTGDVALICWAAAEAGHSELPHALARLGQLDSGQAPLDVVSASWVVSALVAARAQADVEEQLAAARQRLLGARGDGGYPHLTGAGPGTAPTWAASPTRCTRSRRWPGCTAAPPTRRRSPWPTPWPGPSATRRGRPGSGGGTTTRGPARSSRATRCTPCTSTRWPRWRCSTWPTRAATPTWPRSAAGCAGCGRRPANDRPAHADRQHAAARWLAGSKTAVWRTPDHLAEDRPG